MPQTAGTVEPVNPTAAQLAMQLARSGRVIDGKLVLREAQARGEAEAHLLEGLWLLEGRFVPRDFLRARAALRTAAELGHVGAARTLTGLVAAGVGAPADWALAMSMLEEWSRSDPIARRQLELIQRMKLDDQGAPLGEYRSRQLLSDPRVERVDGLLDRQECAFLIELADPRMRRAMIFHEREQRFIEDPVRRSDKAAFPIVSEWPFVRAINLRIAAATRTAVECGEPLQVLKYQATQEYRPHFDAIPGMDNPRVLTALIWLNEDYSGGETRFDDLALAERGRSGDLIVFANTDREGSPDPRTRHCGAPVTSGVKYLASRWIRSRAASEEGFGPHEVERPSGAATQPLHQQHLR